MEIGEAGIKEGEIAGASSEIDLTRPWHGEVGNSRSDEEPKRGNAARFFFVEIQPHVFCFAQVDLCRDRAISDRALLDLMPFRAVSGNPEKIYCFLKCDPSMSRFGSVTVELDKPLWITEFNFVVISPRGPKLPCAENAGPAQPERIHSVLRDKRRRCSTILMRSGKRVIGNVPT